MQLGFSVSLVAIQGGGSSAPILSVVDGVVTATARQNPAPTLVVVNGVVTATARQ